MTACAAVYPADELLVVGTKLYDAVKVEIINGDPDPGLRDTSLDAITALTKAMTSQGIESEKEVEVTRVLKSLVDDCITLLNELDEDSVKPASLVLRAAASASRTFFFKKKQISPSIMECISDPIHIAFAYSYIESAILPLLLRQYREHDAMVDRYLILCTMVAIIQARKIVFGQASGNDNDGTHT